MPDFMKEALQEAKIGLDEGGIPIGAVLVIAGQIVGRGHNRRVQKNSSVLHGETDCIENARVPDEQGNPRRLKPAEFRESTIYTTLSPCPMCTGAILLYKIPRVVIGENRNFLGSEDYLIANGVEIEVVNDPECIDVMSRFIEENPALWNEDIGEI